jgi:hypothetical protein
MYLYEGSGNSAVRRPYELQQVSSAISLYVHWRDVLEAVQDRLQKGSSVNDILTQGQLHYIWNTTSNNVDIQVLFYTWFL